MVTYFREALIILVFLMNSYIFYFCLFFSIFHFLFCIFYPFSILFFYFFFFIFFRYSYRYISFGTKHEEGGTIKAND